MAKKKAVKSSNNENLDSEVDSGAAIPRGFEDLLGEVEEVVEELESGELSLDESLESYEKGVRSLRQCLQHLQRAERRIELLVGFDGDGNPLSQSFDENAATLEEKQLNRAQSRGITPDRTAEGGSRSTKRDSTYSGFSDPLESEDRDFGEGSSMDDSPGLF